jgi:hypothetical protein
MPADETAWTPEQKAEATILNAILTVLALRSKVDARTFNRVPSLHDFVAAASNVAKEIGWGDEPSDEG